MTVVLDAGVLIGLLDPSDAHHDASRRVFRTGFQFWVHPLNIGEALITPERAGRGFEALEDLRRAGVVAATLGPDEPLLVARIRAQHGLRMPDACALAAAVHNDLPLVTFDKRLAAEAKKRGLFEPVPA